MSEWYAGTSNDNALSHHGILGQKWGIRRYQNPDGSLTPEGKARYGANYEKGVPVSKLKSALRDYNTRTGQNIKLKDARTVRIGQYLYDKKGRRVSENTTVESNKKSANSGNNQNQQNQNQQNNGQKKKGAVSSFLAEQGAKAVSNISEAAINVGKQYVQKQLKEALGLAPDEVPKDAINMQALYNKPRSSWTMKDWNFNRLYGEEYQEYVSNQKQAKAKAAEQAKQLKEEAAKKEAEAAQAKLEEDYVRSWYEKNKPAAEKTNFDKIVESNSKEEAWKVLGGSDSPASSVTTEDNIDTGSIFVDEYRNRKI